MPSAKISALTALDSTANLAQLYIPLFKADGSPDNPRILASDLLLAADGVNITPAWSGTGTATTPLLVNVTADPGPANAASKLLDLQVGGVSTVASLKRGTIHFPVAFNSPTALPCAGIGNYYGFLGLYGQTGAIGAYVNAGGINTVGSNSTYAINDTVVLNSDAADCLALRRSGNAEILRVYETYTDSTTFSRGVFGFRDSASGGTGTGSATTVLRIGTEKGSIGGTEKGISFVTDGTERGGFLTGSNGFFSSNGFNFQNSTTGSNLTLHSGNILVKSNDAYNFKVIGSKELRLPSTASLTFANGTSFAGTVDTAITRPAANILGITNGSTGPGTLAIDNVQGTNFERLKMEWDTNVARIGTSKGGSGKARDFAIITDNTVRITFAAAGGQTAADGHNMAFGTSTGTKIGTATGQKIGFWNATPVVQQVLATGAGATVDNVITLLQTLGLCKQS